MSAAELAWFVHEDGAFVPQVLAQSRWSKEGCTAWPSSPCPLPASTTCRSSPVTRTGNDWSDNFADHHDAERHATWDGTKAAPGV